MEAEQVTAVDILEDMFTVRDSSSMVDMVSSNALHKVKRCTGGGSTCCLWRYLVEWLSLGWVSKQANTKMLTLVWTVGGFVLVLTVPPDINKTVCKAYHL